MTMTIEERVQLIEAYMNENCISEAKQVLRGLEAKALELQADLKAYKEGIPIEDRHKDGREYFVGRKGDPWGVYFWCDKPNHWGEIGWQEECNRRDGFISHHVEKPTHVFYPLPQREQETKGEE